MPRASGIREVSDEALNEHAINTALFHPFEMPQHGFAIGGAEHCCRLAIGGEKAGGITFIRIQLTHIGPQIRLAASGPEPIPPTPMSPPAAIAISLRGKPALVAAHHL